MMKRENEKEVSLAVLSFLKSGFFAAASVMVMVLAVVVVLFAVSAVSASAQPLMNFSFVDKHRWRISPGADILCRNREK